MSMFFLQQATLIRPLQTNSHVHDAKLTKLYCSRGLVGKRKYEFESQQKQKENPNSGIMQTSSYDRF
jgi:hypothetical protein